MSDQAFIDLYERDGWAGGSGTGSRPEVNIDYIALISRFISLNDVKTVVDFGCGDWQFSRYINWSNVDYLGVDVVPSVIDRNISSFPQTNLRFEVFRSIDQLGTADLVLCKDVFQHLPNTQVSYYLREFRERFRWMLITNDDHPSDSLNKDIISGQWRALRLDKEPFCERCTAIHEWTVFREAPAMRKRTELIIGHPSTASRASRVMSVQHPHRKFAALPRRILQTWKTKDDLPENFKAWSDTVKNKNPSYKYVLTDDADNRSFMLSNFPWFMSQYDRYPLEIQRVDVFRYFWLFLHGGFYLDLDVECLRPLDVHLEAGDVVLGQMGPDPAFPDSIPNAIMASRPHQEFWLSVIAKLLTKNVEHAPEVSTGPIMLREAVMAWLNDREAARTTTVEIVSQLNNELRTLIQRTETITVLPARTWYPLDWSDSVHQRFRVAVHQEGRLLPGEAEKLFPKSTLVTYWTHSW